jgi:hypothetical protein
MAVYNTIFYLVSYFHAVSYKNVLFVMQRVLGQGKKYHDCRKQLSVGRHRHVN